MDGGALLRVITTATTTHTHTHTTVLVHYRSPLRSQPSWCVYRSLACTK
jgi:hypothetical protein